jgi:hypothetical protein
MNAQKAFMFVVNAINGNNKTRLLNLFQEPVPTKFAVMIIKHYKYYFTKNVFFGNRTKTTGIL